MSAELKPCPFCGEPVDTFKPRGFNVSIMCDFCETIGPICSSAETAIEAWNTRKGQEDEAQNP